MSRLVIGVASSALFDLTESDEIFTKQGIAAYEEHQRIHEDDPLTPGVAFPLVRRLLALNDLAEGRDRLVEIVVLSRNSPRTGLRVMNSARHHALGIERSIFTEGEAPFRYMNVLNMSLFLSANRADVLRATAQGLPAGHVQDSTFVDDPDDDQLRVAFDFDGVVVDAAAERVYQRDGLDAFERSEHESARLPHNPGPLHRFARELSKIQRLEMAQAALGEGYRPRVRVAVITARGAPSQQRAIKTLEDMDLVVNDAFFLGGVEKGLITSVLRPHVYFDDQQTHLDSTRESAPSVWVPFDQVDHLAVQAADFEGQR